MIYVKDANTVLALNIFDIAAFIKECVCGTHFIYNIYVYIILRILTEMNTFQRPQIHCEDLFPKGRKHM